MYHVITYHSPIGKIILAGRGEFLTGLWFEGQKYFGAGLERQEISEDKEPTLVLKAAMDWLDQYFSGQCPDIGGLPLKPSGTDFQKEIWRILCEIPYGKTMTYGKIAEQISRDYFVREGILGDNLPRSKKPRKMSPQAVGGAVGHNPISIIIPCHRVLGADGSLTGYAGGVDRKLWLLQHENNYRIFY